jgi:O-succinylhomoserine sulfhydrylase
MEERNFETDAIRAQTDRSDNKEHSVPIYLTSSFVFDDAEHARALFADEVARKYLYALFKSKHQRVY